jgi:hypothetical protein
MNFLRNAILGDTNGADTNEPRNTRSKNLQSRRQRRSYQDDYFSDDDDWGMSALSATRSSLHRPNAHPGATADYNVDIGNSIGSTRSREIFWDQNSVGTEQGKLEGGGGNNSRVGKSPGGMQSWEKAAMYQDSLENAFSIGDDDYYNSDQRSLEEDKKAYDEVQEDLRTVEDEQEEESDDNKEDVANAYRDYLKSIREGGFETYLNAEDEDETPDFDNMAFGDDKNTPVVTNKKGGGRVLQIEEDRSLYGGLYGVRDMRAQDSPYTSWRAKAQALVDYDNKRQRDNSQSPLRSGIQRFRRKGALNVENGRDFEDEMMSRRGHYSHPLFHSGRFKRFCFCSVLMFAVAVGLYNSVYHRSKPESSHIPPKTQSTPQQNKEDTHLYVPPSASNAIVNTLKTFDPVWFDRRSGWEGITFVDAVNFCKSKEKRVPCSYELYCNEGPGLPPYEGVKSNGEQWAAISNGPNQWVQVGTMNNDPTHTCKTYKQILGELPEWGITGISTEHAHGAGGITQNLMCCLNANHLNADWYIADEDDTAGEPSTNLDANSNTAAADTAAAQDSTVSEVTNTAVAEDTTEEVNDPSNGNVAVISANIKIQQREKAVISAFQPVWFASSHGWDGTTYDAAVNFCESYDHMVLCPFSAYCPNGPGSPPLSGSMVLEIDGEEWAPVNGPPNSWVQLGTISGEPNSRCALYHDLLGNRPQWGLDGSKPELKHHVMCCLM